MTIWLTGLIVLPSAIWIAGALKWLLASTRKPGLYRQPDVSVVVVARNEELTIEACLRSISVQGSLVKEIVLMDDSSTDRTLEQAQSIAKECPKLIVEAVSSDETPVSPKKHALSLAFANISGKYVALTDADCAVPTKWLSSFASELEHNTGSVLGASWPHKPKSFSERVYRWERLIANTLMASACGWGSPASACGHSILYLHEALKKVDAPIRPDLPSGDDDLTVQAVAKAGYKVKFCASPDSVVADLGGLRGSRWSQAARHQSVTHLYPIHWRLLFVATIVSNLMSILLLFYLPFSESPFFFSKVLALKVLIDAAAGATLALKLRLDISVLEIILASLLLPIWTVWRALAGTLGKTYYWRGRKMDATCMLV